MGNGSLLTATYPTFVSSSFSATFPAGTGTPVTVTIGVRKISNGTQTLVTLIIPQILVTMQTVTTITLQTSGSVLTTDLRPAVLAYIPINIRNGATYTMGLIWIYPNGFIGLSDVSGNPSYFTPGAICGVPLTTQISYAI
jgi:hypothetical protein